MLNSQSVNLGSSQKQQKGRDLSEQTAGLVDHLPCGTETALWFWMQTWFTGITNALGSCTARTWLAGVESLLIHKKGANLLQSHGIRNHSIRNQDTHCQQPSHSCEGTEVVSPSCVCLSLANASWTFLSFPHKIVQSRFPYSWLECILPLTFIYANGWRYWCRQGDKRSLKQV